MSAVSGAGARAAVAGALLVSTTACAPAVLWSRHTSDRLLEVEVRGAPGKMWLATAARGAPARARRSPPFEQIAVDDAVFSDDGAHFALPARSGARWSVVRDLSVGPAWDGVAALAFDPTGRHLAYAAEDRGRWRLVVDDEPGPPVSAIAEPISFSEDGARVGYVSLDDGPGACARVVIGGAAGPCWRGVAALAVGCAPATDTYVAVADGAKVVVRGGAPIARVDDVGELRAARCGARWAATVREGAQWRAVVDGEARPPARHVAELAFGPAGRHVAYAVERDGWSMDVDGLEGERFEGVGPPTFSADGAHVGYLGERAGTRWLIIDGRAQPAAPTALGLTLGPDGQRFAYVAGSAAHPLVVCDGAAHPFPLVVERTIAFSRDGRHWGVLAGDPAARALFVAVDGRARARVDTTELFGGRAAGAPDAGGAWLQRWVAAEMELLLAEEGRP